MTIWNPWHGCHKVSPGCANCYMYRRDAEFGKDSSVVAKTASFRLPVQRTRQGDYKLKGAGCVYTCMTSDFFVEEADGWREEAWGFIRARPDLSFYIITKRIHRFEVGLPPDWGAGYDNVTICSTCEDQRTADERIPLMLGLPIRHREVIHEPMLERIDIERYLRSGKVGQVTCGGESGPGARPCRYEWVIDTREQCMRCRVPFHFKQTGAVFVKDGRTYHVPRRLQMEQAAKASIDLSLGSRIMGENVSAATSQSANNSLH